MGSPAPAENPSPPRSPRSPLLDGLRTRLEKINEWVEATGHGVPGASFVLGWWRRAGLRWAIAAFVALGMPIGGYSTLLHSAVNVLPDWVGDFGVQFEAKEWDLKPLSFDAVARDVTLRRDDRSAPVFTAAEVVFDGSPWSMLRGLFSPGAYYNGITIRRGEIVLERSLVGSWNWMDLFDAVPPDRRDAALNGLYQIEGVYLDDVRVVYTEHVPGRSGGGVIQSAQATVHVDEIAGEILRLVPRATPGDRPTRFHLKARSADGIVEVKGAAGLFGASEPVTNPETVATSGGDGPMRLTGPFFDLTIYLGNIGLGAYAQMVPTTRLMPIRGTLQGTLELDRSQEGLRCRSNLAAEGLQLSPNPRLVVVRAQYDELQRDLSGFTMSGPFNPCESGPTDPRKPAQSAHTVTAMLAALNAQATTDAPASVRVFAALDRQEVAGVVIDATMSSLMRRVSQRLKLPSSLTGIPDEATAESSNGGNPVTKGLKSLGGGIKRLFGGGKKDSRR
jgi:hypothetical protein